MYMCQIMYKQSGGLLFYVVINGPGPGPFMFYRDQLCPGINGPGGPIMSNINGPPGPLMPGPFML